MDGGQSLTTAFIALGSNLGPRSAVFDRAIELLESEPRLRVVARSSWYETEPFGQVQPWYLNGVVRVETGLSPLVLLSWLHAVERACGRIRNGVRWGPRVLDLDLITYGKTRIHTPTIVLPHPGWRRPFVRVPLAEVGGVPVAS